MIDSNSVILTEAELKITEEVGRERWRYARRTGRDPGNGTSSALIPANDLRATPTEYALSIILNLYWRPTIGQLDQPDVGGLIEARSCGRTTDHLIIKPREIKDKPLRPFVLVLAERLRYTALGWLRAGDAKRFDMRNNGDWGHYVPQSALHSIDALRAWINVRR